MKLRNRFVVSVFALTTLVFMGSEWNQTRYSSAVVASCIEVAQLDGRSQHFELLCGQQQMLLATAARDRLIAGLLLTLAITGLVALWLRRAVAKPLQSVLHHVRQMGLGSWGMGAWQCNPTPDRREIAGCCDEVLDLANAVHDLGVRLDLSLSRIEAVSRRSIMALLTRRTERRLELIREYLASAGQTIESARTHQQLPPRRLLEQLAFVEREIVSLERALESDFLEELNHHPLPHSAPPRPEKQKTPAEIALNDPEKQPAISSAL